MAKKKRRKPPPPRRRPGTPPRSEMGASDADVWQDPTAKRWIRHVLDGMAPKMSDSVFVTQLIPKPGEHSEGDVKFWVELGASIMMEKPVLAVAQEGQRLPSKLEEIADEIVYLPPDDQMGPEAQERIMAGMRRMMERLDLAA